jgi:hypothetical protein
VVPASAKHREEIMEQESSRADRRDLARSATSLVETCVRNTGLEDFHAGIFPGSKTGDYSDVKVVTPYGEIPWTELSRISDEEMKRLMIEIVNRVFTYLSYPDELAKLSASARKWNQPRLDSNLMKTVRRRKAAMALPSEIST